MLPDFFDRTLSEWAGYIILSVGFVFALIFQFGFYFKLLLVKKHNDNETQNSISVLLNVRNEEERIENILKQLLAQKYENYEVIVVDDFSEDATLTIIGVYAQKYPKIKFSSLSQETFFSEKLAINLALKAAQSDWVVFVKPNAEKLDQSYLQELNNSISAPEAFTLGYTNYAPQKGFYNRWCRVERFHSFMKSAAYSSSRLSIFYHDENVLFPKQVYFDTDGFRGKMYAHHANLELLFNQMKKRQVIISFDEETQIRESVDLQKNDFVESVRKRILLYGSLRWKKKILLLAEGVSKLFLFFGLLWLSITEIQNWLIFTIPVLLVVLIHVFMVKTMLKRLNEKKIFLSSLLYVLAKPVVDIFHRIIIHTHVQRNKWN